MRVIIRGIDRTDYIKSLGDEEMVAVYFEEVKDSQPIGDESLANLHQRNNNLLSAMLAVLADSSHDEDGTETLSDASDEEIPAFDYSSLEEDEEGSESDTEVEIEYSDIDAFYYD